MNILYGIIGIAASYLMLRYRKQVIGFTGQWSFAEKIFGPGHTDLALFLIAVFVFFFSVSVMTGFMDSMLDTSVGSMAETQQKPTFESR